MTDGRPVPMVAVCIPVHRDGAELPRLLTAIAADGWPQDLLRVVVAFDGPHDDLAPVARALGAQVVSLAEQRGSYAARNLALDHIETADVVIFTDADCIPRPGWVNSHVAALAHCDLSGGAIDVTLRPRPSPAEFVDRVRHLQQEHYVANDGYAATANLAVRREVADLRFNGRLRSGGDAEFCRRATAGGYRLAYTADAVVEHPARRSTADVLKKVRRIARGIESRPDYWHDRARPPVRLRKWLVHRARREGHRRGLLWEVRVLALDYVASALIARSVDRVHRTAHRRPSTTEVVA